MIFWNKLKNENFKDDDFLLDDDNETNKEILVESKFGYINPEKALELQNQNFRKKLKKKQALLLIIKY